MEFPREYIEQCEKDWKTRDDELIKAIADCLELLDGEDYEGVAKALIDYLAERGYAILSD